MGVPVVFTATGAPGPMTPFTPPPPGPNTFTTTARVVGPAGPIGGNPPPAFTPGRSDQLRAELAIEIGTAGIPAAASLDDDGSKRHGMFFDRFIVQALTAREAAVSGHALDPHAPPADFASTNGVVVAVPVACGHLITPTSIQVGDSRGMVRPINGSISTPSLRAMLPLVALPDGSIGQAITPSDGVDLFVTIHYNEVVCGGSGDTVAVTVHRDPVRVLTEPPRPISPASLTVSGPVVVHVQGMLDLNGVPRYLAAADGPPELAEAAVASGSQWRLQPTRMNGAPIATPISLGVTFLPGNTPANASAVAPSTGPTPSMSSTVGGRLTHDTTTPNVAGLDAASSKCSVTTDESYGVALASPVKVGGGVAAGPAREQQYMSALRGPAGQGLHFARLGSVLGPDKTILDMYEVSYPGLTQAIRVYVDEYRSETLQAPRGFTCAAPLDIK
jgi:hypothetical protein